MGAALAEICLLGKKISLITPKGDTLESDVAVYFDSKLRKLQSISLAKVRVKPPKPAMGTGGWAASPEAKEPGK